MLDGFFLVVILADVFPIILFIFKQFCLANLIMF